MKKLKNPEKYVKVLKNKLAFAEDSADFWRQEAEKKQAEKEAASGAYLFRYETGVTKGVLLNKDQARRCRIEDSVILHAKVSEIRREGEKYSVTFEIGEVRIVG